MYLAHFWGSFQCSCTVSETQTNKMNHKPFCLEASIDLHGFLLHPIFEIDINNYNSNKLDMIVLL